METSAVLAILGLSVLNLLISWWNTYVCGTVWKEAHEDGFFSTLLVWSGAIQAGIGFSSVYLIALLAIVTACVGDLTQAQLMQFWKVGLSMWYIAVIFPVLGTGLIITLHSWREAYRQRTFGSTAVAAWNTYAQVSNTIDAFEGVGDAAGVVGEAVSGLFDGDAEEIPVKVGLLGLLVAVCSLLLGAFMAKWLISYYAARAPRYVVAR